MLLFLRWLGILTAAAWFGAAVSFALAVGPAFSSDAMLKLLPASHAEAAAQIVADRFLTAQYLCGLLALAHMVGGKLYTGRPIQRASLCLTVGLLGLALISASLFQPKLKKNHLDTFGTRSTPQQRIQGQRWFGIWNFISTSANVVMILGLSVHLLQTVSSEASYRYIAGPKIRG